jgi:hypothetical protein
VIQGDGSSAPPARGFFARLFSGGKDPDEVNEDSAPKTARVAVASVSSSKAKTVSVERIVPLPTSRPSAVAVVAAEPKTSVAAMTVKPASQSFVTASLGGSLFDNRGYWRGAIQNGPDLPRAVTASTKYQTASLDPTTTGTTALAYAAESEMPKPTQARPMGALPKRESSEATVIQAQGNTTIAEKAALTPAQANGGQPVESPWLRAAILTPSFSSAMTTTRLGAGDMRPLHGLLHKPAHSLAMSFSADPTPDISPSRFNGGPAIVFLATTTFATQSTASAFALQTTALR